MKSRFTFWAPVLILLFITSWILSVQALWDYFPLTIDDVQSKDVFFGGLFTLTILFLFGELKNKILRVTILTSQIEHRNLLFTHKVFLLKDISGYVTCEVSAKGTYEYIYLVMNDKKIVSISEFYHRNYGELKAEISKSLPYLGKINYSPFRDLRSIFGN